MRSKSGSAVSTAKTKRTRSREHERITRQADYALRVVRRREGDAAVLYRRRLDEQGRERFQRVTSLGPIAFGAGMVLLRAAIRGSGGGSGVNGKIAYGPFHPLDAAWGARVACYALIASGLRDVERLHRAAAHIQSADATEAAWWFGLMTRADGTRAIRALRILTEAVQ